MGISNKKAIRYHWEVLDDYSTTNNNNISHTGLCEKDLATNVLLEPGNTNVIPSVCSNGMSYFQALLKNSGNQCYSHSHYSVFVI